jgi:hypothetical protein
MTEKRGPKGIFNPVGPSHSVAMENPFHNLPQKVKVGREVDLAPLI